MPAFRPPKSENAAPHMATMGAIAITMVAGITALTLVVQVRMAEPTCDLVASRQLRTDPQCTAVARASVPPCIPDIIPGIFLDWSGHERPARAARLVDRR